MPPYNRLISLTMFGCVGLLSGGALAAEPNKKDEGDVVFDNRGAGKKKVEQEQQAEEPADTKDVDTPFADTAPDPAALRAQRWQPGFGAAARLGFAFPFGSLGAGELSDAANGLLFAWGDFGYWPLPYLFGGLAVSGGYVFAECKGFDSCSGWQLRAGPEIIARFLPFEKVTPWVGVGFGYEFLWLKFSNATNKQKISARGVELVNFQAGVDVLTSGTFLGIFASYSIGKYSSGTVDNEIGGSSTENALGGSGSHSWLAIGGRGTFE